MAKGLSFAAAMLARRRASDPELVTGTDVGVDKKKKAAKKKAIKTSATANGSKQMRSAKNDLEQRGFAAIVAGLQVGLISITQALPDRVPRKVGVGFANEGHRVLQLWGEQFSTEGLSQLAVLTAQVAGNTNSKKGFKSVAGLFSDVANRLLRHTPQKEQETVLAALHTAVNELAPNLAVVRDEDKKKDKGADDGVEVTGQTGEATQIAAAEQAGKANKTGKRPVFRVRLVKGNPAPAPGEKT